MNMRNCIDSARHRIIDEANSAVVKRVAAPNQAPPVQNLKYTAQKLVQPPPPMEFKAFPCPPPFGGYMGVPPGKY